jgi:selenocysteine lyase/cysteine desulfurase
VQARRRRHEAPGGRLHATSAAATTTSGWTAYEGLRVAAARLINADRSEIALVKNTSEGIATVAMGLDWKPGDRMVAFLEEFPANYYPWKRLEEKGLAVTWLSVEDPLDKIADAARGAKLLAISFVQFLSGYRAPIQAIGEICHANRCIFLVDAIQGLGAFPLDVKASISMPWRPTATSGCWVRKVAASLHKSGTSGPRRASGIRLDQRRRVQRLRLP